MIQHVLPLFHSLNADLDLHRLITIPTVQLLVKYSIAAWNIYIEAIRIIGKDLKMMRVMV